MLDPSLIRERLKTVRTALENRGMTLTSELEDLAALESQRRRLLPELEGLKREQNTAGDDSRRWTGPLPQRRQTSVVSENF